MSDKKFVKLYEREEGYVYVASWSGGKDSTFMVDQLLRNKEPLDLIIFSNTGYEFRDMYDYIQKVKKYWEEKYGANIVLLNDNNKGKEVWKKWAEGKFTKGQYIGRPRGFPFSMGMSWCTRELKIKPMENYIRSKYGKNTPIYHYVGIASDEESRIKDEPGILYPIVEWGLTEKEVEEILIERGMHNPLYNHFSRTGCYLCPKQSIKSLFKLWKFYPEEWNEFKRLEAHYQSIGAAITKIKGYSIEELEAKFRKYEEKGKEPENNREDEIEIGCFCK